MRPSARSLVCGERWSGAASQRFASLLRGCPLLVKVFSAVHSVLHVDVYRYAGLQGLIHIRDVLIDEGYAELADECYESKVRTSSLVGSRAALCPRVHEGGCQLLESSVPARGDRWCRCQGLLGFLETKVWQLGGVLLVPYCEAGFFLLEVENRCENVLYVGSF